MKLSLLNGCILHAAGTCLFLLTCLKNPVHAQELISNAVTQGKSPAALFKVNSTLFFTATDATHGRELWKTDGSEAGTELVKDIFQGSAGAAPANFVHVNGTLFFAAEDGTHGRELWKSNGTAEGTGLVKDIAPGAGSFGLSQFTQVNGRLFFLVDDGTNGPVIWLSDGTASGTKPVWASLGLEAAELTAANNQLFFTATDATHGRELWKSDGTEAGTTLVRDIVPGPTGSNGEIAYRQYLTAVNGTLYLVADSVWEGAGNVAFPAIWKSDGTEAGTVLVYDAAGDPYFPPKELTNVNGTLFFSTDSPLCHCSDVWYTDGTPAGTHRIEGFQGTNYVSFQGKTFFSGADPTGNPSIPVHERELWYTDGSQAGTQLLKDIRPGTYEELTNEGILEIRYGSFPENLTVVNGWLFFTADDGVHGRELWKTGGSESKTALVADLNPGAASAEAAFLVDLNGVLFFTAQDGTNGMNIWKYDPNETACQSTGTITKEFWASVPGHRISDIPVDTEPTSISSLTSFETPSNVGNNYAQRIRGYLCAQATGNYTFFIASDNDGELWLSSDDEPGNKQRIAYMRDYAKPQQWKKYASQQSKPVALEAGKRYYIEALHKEGGGGDNLAVGWLTPDAGSSAPVVIPGAVLSPFLINSIARTSDASGAPEIVTMKAYPNPFLGNLRVQFGSEQSGQGLLQLYNLQGQVVRSIWQNTLLAGQEVDLEVNGADLPAGLYVLRLVQGNQYHHLKVVRQP
jgi:ELWxxDGT repeat protein